MKPIPSALAALRLAFPSALHADADEGITWLVRYDGNALPGVPWTAVGNPNAKIEADGLRLNDEGKEFAHYHRP